MIETVRSALLERGLKRGCRFMVTANLLDDMRVHLPITRLGRHTQRILDGQRRAGAMRDDADAVDAKKWAAAVLLIVCFFLDRVERISSEKSADLPHLRVH